jgi:hypothetical protein
MAVVIYTRVVLRDSVQLSGPFDGSNTTFSAPEKFLQGSSRVYHNGRRLKRFNNDHTPLVGEYYETESGGMGTGFDTVVITGFVPSPHSQLLADYVLA